MELAFKKIGKGNPLIILHGLYGSGDNWYTVARELSEKYTVYLVDQRNHGDSPHDADMDYEVMAEDLNRFIESNNLEKPCILGHSMGGKVAMQFAMNYPDKPGRLVVVDIALRNYAPAGDFAQQAQMHQGIIEALSGLDIEVENRTDVDKHLAEAIDHPSVRQFLLKNLKRSKEDNGFYWQINLLALQDNLEHLMDSVAVEGASLDFPTLVISGKHSGYINDKDKEEFGKFFKDLKIEGLEAGHWVHAEKFDEFIAVLKKFLDC